MNNNLVIIISAVAISLVIYLTGKQLNKLGTPYGWILLNIHKLISLVAAVLLGLLIFLTHSIMPLRSITWVVSVSTALFALFAIVTGGLLSTENPPPGFLMLHKFLPYLNALSVVAVLALLLLPST